MTKEKFEAQAVEVSPLERIKAMCQGSEFDCQEAEERAAKVPTRGVLRSYWNGKGDGFRAVLALIRELEK